MNLRDKVKRAVEKESMSEIESLVSLDPRVVRYLVGMSYHQDEKIRSFAARAVGMSAKYHPKLITRVIRRLVWAMNDEYATNPHNPPEVLLAVANEKPEMLITQVPHKTRLAADPGLHEVLAKTLQTIAGRCPGKVGARLSRSLNECREENL
jgi:hypothetical protein